MVVVCTLWPSSWTVRRAPSEAYHLLLVCVCRPLWGTGHYQCLWYIMVVTYICFISIFYQIYFVQFILGIFDELVFFSASSSSRYGGASASANPWADDDDVTDTMDTHQIRQHQQHLVKGDNLNYCFCPLQVFLSWRWVERNIVIIHGVRL